MQIGLNQAVLGSVRKKSEEVEYDYSQELLPEDQQKKTAWDRVHRVDFYIPYSDGEEKYGQLKVSAEAFAALQLGELYLFFFDWIEKYEPVLKNFVPSRGGYDWVASLGDDETVTVEQRLSCKALAASEKEKTRLYEEHVAKGGCPF